MLRDNRASQSQRRIVIALSLLAGCGDDDSANPPADNDDLQPADEVNAAEDAANSVTGSVGVPARLVNDFGQDVTVILRDVVVEDDPDYGRLIVVDVRAENSTDEAQNAPELELRCGDQEMAFYGGTYEWQEMPAGSFLEGTVSSSIQKAARSRSCVRLRWSAVASPFVGISRT